MNRINLMLHAHQPYVRHLEYEKFLEEDWLYEALNESYIPLLRMLKNLEDDNVDYHFSICFSPTLISMLEDEPLQERFIKYLERHIELGEKEVQRTKTEEKECHEMAKVYLKETKLNLELYLGLDRNILKEFKRLSEVGRIELVASAATHAFLPLYKDFPGAVNAQIAVGISTHKRVFGKSPKGFWLPECGYYPGLEKLLLDNGVEWVQLPSQAIISSPDKSLYGGYRPIVIPGGLKAVARDWNLTNLVWSDKTGYPCDPDYREFYRDIGYYLPMEYVRPYMHEPSLRVFTGYKYYSITGNTEEKVYYSPKKAQEKVALHVDNFLYNIRKKGKLLDAYGIGNHVFNLFFDAELFGHRWYEGLSWLEKVIRALAEDKNNYAMVSASSVVEEDEDLDEIRINETSWGPRGGADTWLDSSNAWIYRHTIKAIERMQELTERFPDQGSLKGRFLNQASRELLLAMASDWPCIIHDNTSSSYAEKRICNHLGSFNVVHSSMCRNTVNTEWLIKAEKCNALFPDMDYRYFEKK